MYDDYIFTMKRWPSNVRFTRTRIFIRGCDAMGITIPDRTIFKMASK